MRSHSRESCTSFPAGNLTRSSQTSERMGAFGTMTLDERVSSPMDRPSSSILRPPTVQTHHRSNSQPFPPSHESQTQLRGGPQQQPLYANYPPVRTDSRRSNISANQQPVNRPNQLFINVPNPRSEVIYQPTVSNADTTESRRKYDKLSEVYSTSGDTVELARNLGDYLNEKIHYVITISILLALILIAFVMALIGTLNIPFCPRQPMIPIWLMVAGFLFIVSAVFRIYRVIPSPTRRTTAVARSRNLSMDLCGRVIELMFVLVNIVWLILGCVWVYGVRSNVHFHGTNQLFEEHFCDSTVYYTAFAGVTGYLILICFLVISLICLLAVGSYKETSTPNGSRR